MPPPTTNTDHARIADNLRRTVELTALGLALRQAVLQQRDPQGKSIMTQVMHEIRLAKEQAGRQSQSSSMPALISLPSSIVVASPTHWLEAGPPVRRSSLEPRRTSISSFFLNSLHANTCRRSFLLCSTPPGLIRLR